MSKTYSGSFTSDWQKTYEDTMYYTKLTYGYNTSWINEDYAWAQGSFMTKDYNHNAYVRNDNGAHYGNSVDYRFVSKIEVRHKGSTITYKNQFNAK
ncbi:hypothetical protein TZ02_18530 [Clostridium aceticum]|nr:hypothetical protein TZ02_18530 [Clostridium aceticum]